MCALSCPHSSSSWPGESTLGDHQLTLSAVFRDAYSDGPEQVHFSDPHLEGSDIVERFLQLLLHSRLQPLDPTVDSNARHSAPHVTFNQWVSLVGFLSKWECTGLLRLFGLCISEQLLRGRISPPNAFAIGMLADDPELCVSCLKVKGHLTSPLHVGSFEFRIWQRVKPKYLWALAKAEREAKDMGKEGWSDISEGFRSRLAEADNQVYPR